MLLGCLCHCKGTNFLANHNKNESDAIDEEDVYATADVRGTGDWHILRRCAWGLRGRASAQHGGCERCVCLVGVPFGRDDERPEDYESEIWKTGMMVGSGFKVNGSRSLGSPRVDWLPALRRVTDGRMMVVRVKERMNG